MALGQNLRFFEGFFNGVYIVVFIFSFGMDRGFSFFLLAKQVQYLFRDACHMLPPYSFVFLKV